MYKENPAVANFSLDFTEPLLSPWMNYWLATLVRASLRQDAAVRQAVLAAVDLGYTSYVDQGSSPPSGIPLWFAVKYPNNKVLIVLSGTYLPVQWYGHLAGAGMISGSYFPGKVHSYWEATAFSIGGAITAALGSFSAPQTFYITGHSWGGASGQILAYYLANAYPGSTSQLVTFGAPKVGNAAFAAGFNVPCSNEQNPSDPVCALPPYMDMGVRFLVSGGNIFNFPANYEYAGTNNIWGDGVGPTGGLAASFVRRSNAALSVLLLATDAMRAHSLYYYTLNYYRMSRASVPQTGGVGGSKFGFDLAAINTQNSILSVTEGLVASPAFPVPAGAEP